MWPSCRGHGPWHNRGMAIYGRTLVEMFSFRAEQTPDLVAMRYRSAGAWTPVTFGQWRDRARAAADGLLSLGLARGSRVGLLARNRVEWHVCDLAILLAGGVTVPVYATKSAPQVAGILAHAETGVVIVEDRDQLEKVLASRAGLPGVKTIVVLAGDGLPAQRNVVSFEELCRLGRDHALAHPGELDERSGSLAPGDIASVVYTSGTTGTPKGALLSHNNFVQTLRAGIERIGLGEGERLVSYLTYAHIFERLITEWASVSFGGEVWFAESMATLPDTLRDCRPTFFIGVPRVFEKVTHAVESEMARQAALRRVLIQRAVAAGTQVVECRQALRPVPLWLRLRHQVLDTLVTSRVRRELGMDACKVAISGAAPISREVVVFVNALGIPLLEGYGLTESTAPACVNPPGRNRIGTAGPPLRGVEVRLDADGE